MGGWTGVLGEGWRFDGRKQRRGRAMLEDVRN